MKSIFLGSIGVLVESSYLQLEAYNKALADNNIDFRWNVGNYITALNYPGGYRRLESVLGGQYPKEVLKKVHKDKQIIFSTYLDTKIEARAGIIDLINFSKKNGIGCSFVSTATKFTVESVKKSLESQIDFDFFSLVTSKDDIVAEKPDPEIYHFACNALSMDPNKVLVIEDTLANYRAAVEAGLKCLLFPGNFSQFPLDHPYLTSAAQCIDLLARKNRR